MGNLYGGIATCPDPSWIRDGDGARGADIDQALKDDAQAMVDELREFDEDGADVLQMSLDRAQNDDDVCDVIDRCNDALREAE